MTDVVVLLDLEETLIDIWDEGNFLDVGLDRTKKFLDELVLDGGVRPRLGLMSWAVYNTLDKEEFNRRFRPTIEERLGMKFAEELILTEPNWALRCGRIDEDEDAQPRKEEVLFWLANSRYFMNTQVFLIDDRVSHRCRIECPEWGSSVTFLNINKMED